MTEEKRIYLGLDAGGTKTFCLVGDNTGAILGFGSGGCGNYEVHGVEPAAVENRRAVEAALESAGITLDNVAGIGMGIAGADLPEDYDMLEREIFASLFGDKRRVFRNDSMGALRAGIREPHGIVIACGTGCVCAGRNRQNEETRVGGLGEEFGDITTGAGIGYDGLRAVWQSRDGILPETKLSGLFVQRSNCADVDTLFRKVYHGEIKLPGLEPMAPLVFEAARAGDGVACDILERGGRYLGAMVTAVARRLTMTQEEFSVVMAGSVFKGVSPVLADAMRTVIHRECPMAKTVRPAFEPVVGALFLGMELDHPVDGPIYDRVTEGLITAEQRFGVRLVAE